MLRHGLRHKISQRAFKRRSTRVRRSGHGRYVSVHAAGSPCPSVVVNRHALRNDSSCEAAGTSTVRAAELIRDAHDGKARADRPPSSPAGCQLPRCRPVTTPRMMALCICTTLQSAVELTADRQRHRIPTQRARTCLLGGLLVCEDPLFPQCRVALTRKSRTEHPYNTDRPTRSAEAQSRASPARTLSNLSVDMQAGPGRSHLC